MIYILLSFVLAQASATPAPDGPAAPATVRGRVTDKQTGAPITGAIVRLGKMNPNEPWPTPARTDTDGRFQFSGLTPGIYSGSVSDDQHHLVHKRHVIHVDIRGYQWGHPDHVWQLRFAVSDVGRWCFRRVAGDGPGRL